jgi:hypothetical protein
VVGHLFTTFTASAQSAPAAPRLIKPFHPRNTLLFTHRDLNPLINDPRRSTHIIMTTSAVNSTQSLNAPKPSASQPRQNIIDAFLALPDELKVEILRYILPRQTFTVTDFNRNLRHLNFLEYMEPHPLETNVKPLILTIPDMKDIIYDVMFSSDTVHIRNIHNAIWYPRSSVATFVRSVVLDLDFNDQSLAFLRRFVSGELRFSNMVDVVVHLNGNSDRVQVAQQDMGKAEIVEMRNAFAKKLEAMEAIVFDTKTVTVAYKHARNHVWAEDPRMPLLKLRDTWAQLLLEKMKLKGGEKKVQ